MSFPAYKFAYVTLHMAVSLKNVQAMEVSDGKFSWWMNDVNFPYCPMHTWKNQVQVL